MCGRYALYGPTSRLRAQFQADIDELDFAPRYNAAPLQMLPVIRQRPGGERVAHLLRWGLIPSWSKDPAIASKLINARGETLAEKPSFRSAFKSRRCVIPASGFYEWKSIAGGKQPYFIRPANDEFFGFAGLWERWTPTDGEPLDTFTIITTDANDSLRPLHDRMPVILGVDDYGPWLAKETHPDFVRQLVAPRDANAITMYPVSPKVGNVRNDTPELIEPLEGGTS